MKRYIFMDKKLGSRVELNFRNAQEARKHARWNNLQLLKEESI